MENKKEIYEGKKLLIIGATAFFIDVVEICKKLGIVSIIIDNNPTAKAKPFADIALDVDTYDKEAVLDVAQKYNVDGVFVGWSEQNLYTAHYVCEKMGLNFYATKEQLDYTTNKQKFKQLCVRNQVPVIPELKIEDIQEQDFPVMIKPVDGAGSKGIAVCNNYNELEQNYKIAMKYSHSKKVIIEKCLNMQHVNIYYTLVDGECYLSAMCDRFVTYPKENYPPLPTVLIHNSSVYEKYVETVDAKVKNMFKSIEMKNGAAFVQAFTDGTNFYIYEMGYRLNGGSTYLLMDYFNKYNQVEMLINYALFGKMTNVPIQNNTFNKKGVTLVLSLKNGTIREIKGIEELKNNKYVLTSLQMYHSNDTICVEEGVSQAQIFIYIYLIVEDSDDLQSIVTDIWKSVKVLDIEGKNMLLELNY